MQQKKQVKRTFCTPNSGPQILAPKLYSLPILIYIVHILQCKNLADCIFNVVRPIGKSMLQMLVDTRLTLGLANVR